MAQVMLLRRREREIAQEEELKKRLIVSLAVATLLLAVVAIPSMGATYTTATVTMGARVPVYESTSTNWAGYTVETSLTSPQINAVTDVKAQWTVPSASRRAVNAYSSIWVGIDGYSNSTVEQIGTEQDYINGKAAYYAWYEMYPMSSHAIAHKVSPGDKMSGEVRYSGYRQFVLTLKDQTAGWTFSTTQKAYAQRQSAEWIVEAPSSIGVLPLANFGTVKFSNAQATLNGHQGAISSSAWHYDAMTMVDGAAKATPSALSIGGSAFSVTYSTGP